MHQRDQKHRNHNDGGESWKKSKGASSVERAKVDPFRLLEFANQQCRDQEPRQDEEDVHSD